MTQLTITFLDNLEQEHCLNFKICNTDLANRWQSIVIKNQQTDKFIHGVLMNTTYAQLQSIHAELHSIVTALNELYDKQLPVYTDAILNKNHLNTLHEQFEIYGDRIPELQASGVLNVEVHTNALHLKFCRLNELIHSYEDALVNQSVSFPTMGALIDYYPAGLYVPLLEKDRVYLEGDFKWGHLYLGYNTLGKDWGSVWGDNDLEVIIRDQVRPQKRFAAENWLYFGKDFEKFERISNFEKWYLKLPTAIKDKVPMNNLNELSFGRLYVGSIIIDEYFLKYDSNLTNWQLPNSSTKLKWNNNVFTTFKKITKFNFYEKT